MTHVAWNCDGKKLAAVGIDKVTRVWPPEKIVSRRIRNAAAGWKYVYSQTEMRSASMFSGGHVDDVDYVSWNPAHPELFCTSSQKDRKIVFWDARRKLCHHQYIAFTKASYFLTARHSESRHIQQCSLKVSPTQTNYSPDGKALLYTSAGHQLFFMTFGKEDDESKESWGLSDRDGVC